MEDKKKTQIIFIHGAEAFKDRNEHLEYLRTRKVSLAKKAKWNYDYLGEQLESSFELIKLKMPCQEFAHYDAWKIHFERYLEILDQELILIGSSMGSTFLSKFLSENKTNKTIKGLFLVCPPFNGDGRRPLNGGFDLNNTPLGNLNSVCNNIHLFFSKDDEVVPPTQSANFKKVLTANYHIYESKQGHFTCEEFPELIEAIENTVFCAQEQKSS